MKSGKVKSFKKMDELISKLQMYGTQAAPAYNTSQRLVRSCMEFLASQFNDRISMLEADLTSSDLIDRIRHLRHDHVTLESILMVTDVYLDKKILPSFKKKLFARMTDEDILRLTLNSKSSTLDYIKDTTPIDVIVGHLEGIALHVKKQSIEDFSKEMISLFRECYRVQDQISKAS